MSKGTPLGTVLGAVIEIAAAKNGYALPPGSGAVLGGTLAGAFAFLFRGGRRGESD